MNSALVGDSLHDLTSDLNGLINCGSHFLVPALADPILESSFDEVKHADPQVLDSALEQRLAMLFVLHDVQPLFEASFGFYIVVTSKGVCQNSLSLNFQSLLFRLVVIKSKAVYFDNFAKGLIKTVELGCVRVLSTVFEGNRLCVRLSLPFFEGVTLGPHCEVVE